MANLKEVLAKKTVVGLVLGQILSLLITSTGFSSSELARRGLFFAFHLFLGDFPLMETKLIFLKPVKLPVIVT